MNIKQQQYALKLKNILYQRFGITPSSGSNIINNGRDVMKYITFSYNVQKILILIVIMLIIHRKRI